MAILAQSTSPMLPYPPQKPTFFMDLSDSLPWRVAALPPSGRKRLGLKFQENPELKSASKGIETRQSLPRKVLRSFLVEVSWGTGLFSF
jgi:hypothetical protein